MADADAYVADLWRRAAGRAEALGAQRVPDDAVLRHSEWSDAFEQAMRARLVLGAFRYGRLHAPGKKQYDRTGGVVAKIEEYNRTGNLESLVDAANGCLLEFEEGCHPRRHFASVDDGKHFLEKAAH
jgi:hypothetical protein